MCLLVESVRWASRHSRVDRGGVFLLALTLRCAGCGGGGVLVGSLCQVPGRRWRIGLCGESLLS